MGDFVKGNQLLEYPQGIREGIILHREIDHFTDNHPVVIESKKRLRPKYRHYSPVIIDMYYDHFLATNWKQYSNEELDNFTNRFYDLARKNTHLLPEKVRNLLTHMSRTDWLYNYQFLEGLDQALKGMARRTRFQSGMEEAVEDLQLNYDLYLNEFEIFFPEIIKHCMHD